LVAIPVQAAIVRYKLRGQPVPKWIDICARLDCTNCEAKAGFVCKCWRSRLLTQQQWGIAERARKAGKKAPGGFRDEIYTGLHHIGMGFGNYLSDQGTAAAIRKMTPEDLETVKAILDQPPDSEF
jgi:hypothetical protein